MPEPEPPFLLPRVLFVLLAADAVIIGSIVGSQISAPAGIAAAAVGFVLPWVAIPLVIALLNSFSGWSRLASIYPGQPISDGARRGDAETLALRWSWLAYNMCVRWAADDQHLHLKIAPYFGRLSRPMSIPWPEIDFDETAAPKERFSSALIPLETAAGIRLFVPPQAVEAERARRLAVPAAT